MNDGMIKKPISMTKLRICFLNLVRAKCLSSFDDWRRREALVKIALTMNRQQSKSHVNEDEDDDEVTTQLMTVNDSDDDSSFCCMYVYLSMN